MPPPSVTLVAVPGIPLIEPGDDLAEVLSKALSAAGIPLNDGDVLVVAQKIVSKAEGRYLERASLVPSDRAIALAERTGKDPRHVEAILSESEEIVKTGGDLIIAAHRLGFVMANAGIDESNIDHGDGDGRFLLLPSDPDASAAELKRRLDAEFHTRIGVVINDSFGRPWRNGVVGVALGSAGVPALVDKAGSRDLFGREMRVTEVAVADEIASAGSLLMGQADEGLPAVLVRGLRLRAPVQPAAALVRDRKKDMFR